AKEKQVASPLRVLSDKEVISEDLELREAQVVGRYALQFSWSDGHTEGIYSFDYLRRLCQCDQCKSKQQESVS
ncbi:DUF971 domain-containing protein, partial [candidate division KSB1 bacterium]|nr:DUF971 domain-containing protein [candidate division KSB1 bacterium]NIR71156.1 DUF971 domain-containing protein [candidate division KSB1 bacterium]NIS23286.1 DUF971 domain-containing protein [candidate division KSB1 bacterium]NIT70165.1 DUF971 domain-containing protein [candidate division KSB1 bacterium]NIU23816.1 DUF971 domain-containing protein [candidate division KSB1 bacterium]